MTSIASTSSQRAQTQRLAELEIRDADAELSAYTSTADPKMVSSSIENLNNAIKDLEQNGESHAGQLDDLRAKRDELIVSYTGNSSAEAYDVNIVARAQNNETSYNAEIAQSNYIVIQSNYYRPQDSQLPLLETVEQLPWEQPEVNARVDSLVRNEELSLDAAIVIAMTERKTTIDVNGWNVEVNRPSLQGDWQAGFAARAGRAGPEIEVWALSEINDVSNATINLSAANDDVTILQNADGHIVVRDNTGVAADRIIDPGKSDRVVILGGNGNDRITIDSSVTNNMVVAGGAGDDYLFGGNGNDILIGGDGVDLIRGENGSDIIIGGDDADNIEGGNGGDIILGGAGADYISGGNGNDIIQGAEGRDSLYGGHGEDIISGGAGNDNINGGTGKDLLNGNDGDDSISGGKGDDHLIGGNGVDTLIGASGLDTYDSRFGDNVIRESSESTGSIWANSSIVEIDSELGQLDNFVPTTERSEFRTRVADDLETLRSLESGQQMLTDLADITARTGNTTTIRELDGTQKTMVLPTTGTTAVTENGFAAVPSGTRFSDIGSGYGQPAAAGVDSTIYYNPSVNIPLSEATGGEAVPPVVVLFHELSHSYNQTSGTVILGSYNVPGETDAVVAGRTDVGNVERQAVGLSVSFDHDGDPLTDEIDMPNTTGQQTENDLRNELGIGDRVSYR